MSARIRTGYSFRNSAGDIPAVIKAIKAAGYTHAPITDRASTFGFVRWRKACEKAGLTPVYGVELGVTPSPEAKRPVFDHWTFLAKHTMRPLNELLGLATRQFRYEPLLTYTQALNQPDLVKIMGRRADLSLLQPVADLYVAASPSANLSYLRAAVKAGAALIACCDNHYPTESDEPFYQVLVGRNAGSQTYPRHIMSDQDWFEAMLDIGMAETECQLALANRDAVLAECMAALPRGTLLHPAITKTLAEQCTEGATALGIDLADPVYAARLKRELDLIYEKKFEDYFYVVGDMVRWARARMTVGPARGSSCGSLVCYLLRITLVDPIPNGLLFERFISLDRPDMPDIDCDFSDNKRQLVFDYLEQTYGKDRVARLGTVSKFGAASSLNTAAAALRIPKWESQGVLEAIIKRSSGDARKLEQLGEALRETAPGQQLLAKHPGMAVAARFESHPSHYSQHACGVILTNLPVTEYVGVDIRTGATHCDKKDAEDLDLLKIDCLGLTQLSVFEDALKLAGLKHDHLDTVPLDDKRALEVLNNKHYAGIFQFQGPALKSVARQVVFTELEDIIAITALARPGTLSNGAATTWVRRKMGKEPVSYWHPSFEPITKDSFGIILYQEQVMIVGREIGGLSWEDVSSIRRSMSKSLGPEYFDQFGQRWKAGAIANGLPPEILDKIWNDLCSYGAMSFNKSHSVAYGIVSYWCCWMKAYYPLEFAAATLQHETDDNKRIGFLRELAAEGIGYVPVSAEHSTDKWTVATVGNEKKLIGPVTNVKGLGGVLMKQFMSARARGEPLSPRLEKLLASPVTPLDSLWPVRDAFERVMPDPHARNIFTVPVSVASVVESDHRDTVLLFVTIAKMNMRDENEHVNVVKRGGKVFEDGMTTSLVLTLRDDTGTMFGKVDRFNFQKIGKDLVSRGKVGKALYAVRGKAWGDQQFRGVTVDAVRFIGEM